MASDTRAPSQARAKVGLKPGFHLMDWVKLSRASTDLSGNKGQGPRQITVEELAEHSSQFDCWTSYKGKVYNLTPYLPYHPGGDAILMDVAGKDCTELVAKYHRWVNVESMILKCVVGTLVGNSIGKIDEDEGHDDDDDENSALPALALEPQNPSPDTASDVPFEAK